MQSGRAEARAAGELAALNKIGTLSVTQYSLAALELLHCSTTHKHTN
jgi:hypothetical protein